jgi:glycosyltransferase involved in cell wall biosynthesis
MNPKVSILTITYNHENFIAQAIESALMQKVDFPYEIVIGEDGSTDRTREILLHYQARYPDRVRLLLNETNLGAHQNFLNTLTACQGEYIALLEGDDYWISPYKLQKQVDLLDHHPDAALCFHNAQVVYEGTDAHPILFHAGDQKEVFTLTDLLSTNFIPTASVLYRRNTVSHFPDWYFKLKMGDWSLYILVAQQGSLRYINEVMSVYRKHPSGYWTSQSKISQCRETVKMLQTINIYLNYQYEAILEQSISAFYESLVNAAQQDIKQQFIQLQESFAELSQHYQKSQIELAQLRQFVDRSPLAIQPSS